MSTNVTGCDCGEDLHWWKHRHENAWTVQHGENLEHRRDFGARDFFTYSRLGDWSDPVPPILDNLWVWKAIREWLAELHERRR